jgi:hypothetical protein
MNRIPDLIFTAPSSAEHREELDLYAPLIGSWDIESIWYSQDGTRRQGRGEWHFAWILGGYGVQDVLFACDAPSHHYGTSVRCYDITQDLWHITWMQPYGGEFVHLTGHRIGERIVQEGAGTDPRRRERWSFADVTSNSFTWLGEVSFDDGLTWSLEQEMHGTRRVDA